MGQGVFGHARTASMGHWTGGGSRRGSVIRPQPIEFCTLETSSVTGSSYGTEDLDLPAMGYLRMFTEKGNLS
jgi:hypothetical protein